MNSENGPEGGLGSPVFSRVSFVLILLGITVLFVFLVRRFITPTLLAAITSALFGPLYRWVHAGVRMARLAPAVTLVIVLLVFVIPLAPSGIWRSITS